MDRSFIFRTLLTGIFILLLSPIVRAKVPTKMKTVTNSLEKDFAFRTDTAKHQQQDKKKDKDKSNSKEKPNQKPDKPDIKKVPKARKQTRPIVVVKPNIKVRPIKIIRPKIKRP
ncbi:hypothetical protein ACVWYG_002340 [Pedobacter sp. UYEF25]